MHLPFPIGVKLSGTLYQGPAIRDWVPDTTISHVLSGTGYISCLHLPYLGASVTAHILTGGGIRYHVLSVFAPSLFGGKCDSLPATLQMNGYSVRQ